MIILGTALVLLFGLMPRGRRSLLRYDQLALASLPAVLCLPAICVNNHGLSSLFYMASTIGVLTAAARVSRCAPAQLMLHFKILYWTLIAVAVVAIIVFWGEREPLGQVIPGSSTNGIPAYLIIFQINISLAHYLLHKKLPLLTPILTLIVCIFGIGRASILVACLIFLTSFLLNIYLVLRNRGVGWKPVIWAAVLLLITLSIWGPDIFDLVKRFTKLSVGLADTSRFMVVKEYLLKIDPISLITGADYTGTIIEDRYGGNPHIAFIRAHALLGLPYLMVILATPFIFLLSGRHFASSLVFFAFSCLAMLRCTVEPLMFPTLFDLFYFLWIWLFFRWTPRMLRSRGHPDSELILRRREIMA